MSKRKDEREGATEQGTFRSRKAVERGAVFGLILVAVGLFAPFTSLDTIAYIRFFKWVYAAGALIFTVARIVGSTDPAESMHLRRLRRLEFWAGVAFCIGAFFWFYNEEKFSFYLSVGMGSLACLRDTVYFTLAGGAIQIMAVILMSRRAAREKGGRK